MKLLVALAAHYVRGPDGNVYTKGVHRQSFWQRYLEVFDEVEVLARTGTRNELDSGWMQADGPNIQFRALPDYIGPWGYLKARSGLKAVAREAVASADAFILRTGGNAVTALAWKEIRKRRCPYALEVTGDPWDALGPGTVKTWSRPIGRRVYVRNLRLQCWRASAAAYVTREALQRRYPAGPSAYTISCSDVDMPADAYVARPRRFAKPGRRLVQLGGLGNFYKGPDTLVQAVAACVKRGLPVHLRLLGGGERRRELEDMIRSLGIEDHVDLLGLVSQRSVILRELDEADLHVLPSRQEGLPRALVEAMGRGLPCVASTVGGIPELLPPEDLVPPSDAGVLADKIAEVLTDPQRMTRMSARNLKVAGEYRADILVPRRREFYGRVRELSRA